MTLDASGRLGIGTASPSVSLDVNGSAYFRDNSAIVGAGKTLEFISTYPNRTQLYQTAGNNFTFDNISSGGFLFYTNSNLRATLDSSGNLGLGVTPAFRFHVYSLVNNETRFQTASTTAGHTNRLSFSVPTGTADTRSGVIEWYDLNTFKGDMRFLKAGGIQIRNSADSPTLTLDDSGNLGLGVAPSAFSSSFRAVELSSAILMSANDGSAAFFAANTYFNASSQWIYKGNGKAAIYQISNDGLHTWYNSGPTNGTSGGSYSPLQRMVLDVSGRLGIGSTPSYPLHVQYSGQAEFRLHNSSGSGISVISMVAGGQSNPFYLYTDGNRNFIFQDSGTERFTIKGTGAIRFVPMASAPASAAAGDVYYDSTTNKIRCYNGSAWNDLF
jgi:hypothetical protein